MSENSLRLMEAVQEAFPLDRDLAGVGVEADWVKPLVSSLERIAADDFVSEMAADQSFRRERLGVDGFVEGWLDWVEPFESFRVEFEEIIDAGDAVVTLVKQVGRPRGSTTEIESEGAAVWWFRDGRLARVEFHLHREVALRAAGIDPEATLE